MNTFDALTLAAVRLGGTPFVPTDAQGEQALEFRWNSASATWVTDGARHFLALTTPTPARALFGDWSGEPARFFGVIQGTDVYQFPGVPVPKRWLKSEPTRRWLERLHLGPQETVAFSGDGVQATFHVGKPDADADRVLAFLDSLHAVVGRDESADPPSLAPPVVLSPVVEQAIRKFGHLCLSDDVLRSGAIAAASASELIALEQSMARHLGDLDATLSRLERIPHPDIEIAGLMGRLHDLGQATIEARQELARRAAQDR